MDRLLIGYSSTETVVPGLNVYTYNAGSALTPMIPTNGQLWYSEFFDNSGGTLTATAADIQGLAIPLYGAPTVGSTTNNYFVSSTASASTYTTANPPGSIVTATNGGRFGIALQTSVNGAATPEPVTCSLLCFGGLGLWAGIGRRRTRR